MNTTLKYTAACTLLAALLGGCQSMDSGMASTSDFLDTTGDVLSLDFRGLQDAQRTTMGAMATDWTANENNAKQKWDQRRLVVTGIVTRVTHVDGPMPNAPGKFVIVFKDPVDARCVGTATTRDDLLVNEKRTTGLNAGDRIDVTGVLATKADVDSNGAQCRFVFAKAKFEKLPAGAADTAQAASTPAASAKQTSKTGKANKAAKASKTVSQQ
ncbi:hypothetical protein GCM10027093_59390 [Paraburkholderia jirisanensis]